MLQQYVDDGYTIVSGAVPPDLCGRAEDAVWRALRLDRDRPGEWPEGSYQEGSTLRTPEFAACITPAVEQAIDAILGAGRYIWAFAGKETALTPILSLPQKTPSAWKPYPPHVDQRLPLHIPMDPLHRWLRRRRIPTPWLGRQNTRTSSTFALSVLIYLHDVPEQAGATVFWPGSYRDIEDEALRRRSHPVDMLNSGAYRPSVPPRAVPARQGDVALYARNAVHAASLNLGTRPRVALQACINLTGEGLAHCVRGELPRSPFEVNYDRHASAYRDYDYFGCSLGVRRVEPQEPSDESTPPSPAPPARPDLA